MIVARLEPMPDLIENPTWKQRLRAALSHLDRMARFYEFRGRGRGRSDALVRELAGMDPEEARAHRDSLMQVITNQAGTMKVRGAPGIVPRPDDPKTRNRRERVHVAHRLARDKE